MTVDVVYCNDKTTCPWFCFGANNPSPIANPVIVGISVTHTLGRRSAPTGKNVFQGAKVSGFGEDAHPTATFGVNCAAVTFKDESVAQTVRINGGSNGRGEGGGNCRCKGNGRC